MQSAINHLLVKFLYLNFITFFDPITINSIINSIELRSEKTSLRGFRPGLDKPACAVTEAGERLEILDLRSRKIVLSDCSENKGTDQLRGYRKANLRLCFRIGKNLVFSRCCSICFKFLTLEINEATYFHCFGINLNQT